MPTTSAIAYSRTFGPGRDTPMTRATSAGFAVESDSSAERLRLSWAVAASSQSVPPATMAASRARVTGPASSSAREIAERGRPQAAVQVLCLRRDLEWQPVERELRKDGGLLVEPAPVQREAFAVAVGAFEHPAECGQVGRAAHDLDRCPRGRDPERIHTDQRRLVGRQHVEQARREQARIPVVGHRGRS